MNKIHVINGPNLNLLGERPEGAYGSLTMKEIEDLIGVKARDLGVEVSFFQDNHEGNIIDEIHRVRKEADGIIINPGAYTHYSYAIRDALEILRIPVIEVHLSDIDSREDFRKISVIKDVCVDQVKGLGVNSYIKAMEILSEIFRNDDGGQYELA